MKDNIIRSVKYSMLSMKIIFQAGKAKVILWLIALILPPIINICKTIINAKMIDGILNLSNGGSIAEPIFSLVILVLISAGYNLFYKLQSRTFWVLAESADEQMMLHMMNRSSRLKQISFDSALKYSKVKDSIGSDLSLWDLNNNLLDFINTLITIIGVSLIVKNYDVRLIAIALGFSIPFFLIRNFIRKMDEKTSLLFRRKKNVMNYYSNILLSAKVAKEIRLLGIQNVVLSDWFEHNRKFQRQDEKIQLQKKCMALILIFLDILFSFMIYFVCAKSVMDREISIGDFYLYTSNLFLLFEEFKGISKIINDTLHISYEYDSFEKFTKETKAGERGGIEFIPDNDICIRFENVSFGYDGKTVLHNLSFQWKLGEKIALIGKNGSGKSTLIKLICGLYECDSGTIYINDIDIKRYSQRSVYKIFGIVYQDFCHYQLPLRTVLASQRLEDSQNDVLLWNAFEKADCLEFKKQFISGLDTPLGREYDDGVELSGGQWQKIAIARNYFGNRMLLLFDEPAAALDPKAEHRIIGDLLLRSEEFTSKSIIVISHRLSVGRLVDKILYLENGQIVEQGSHSDLMNLNGSYAKMYKTQASFYEKVSEENEKN